ncbi:hypothetical protein CEXT_517491 [Caerostris extrusa]|uniref:Uncharacterized protein n=1 Tax=Caerostris extrusa TaxID=172846 RepID=A0AAV4W6C5_CAEEX|nr:hypothetical protein CEXT_517491 [Caerostris extrusa]
MFGVKFLLECRPAREKKEGDMYSKVFVLKVKNGVLQIRACHWRLSPCILSRPTYFFAIAPKETPNFQKKKKKRRFTSKRCKKVKCCSLKQYRS